MQIMWAVIHPKLVSNVVGIKTTPAILTAVVSSWAFLFTSMAGWRLDLKNCQDLLDKEDRSVRIAAGEALALMFEIGTLDKVSAEAKEPSDDSTGGGTKFREGIIHIQGLRAKVVNQVRNLSVEAGGKGSAKKDLNNQRNVFKGILEFLEGGYQAESSLKIGAYMV